MTYVRVVAGNEELDGSGMREGEKYHSPQVAKLTQRRRRRGVSLGDPLPSLSPPDPGYNGMQPCQHAYHAIYGEVLSQEHEVAPSTSTPDPHPTSKPAHVLDSALLSELLAAFLGLAAESRPRVWTPGGAAPLAGVAGAEAPAPLARPGVPAAGTGATAGLPAPAGAAARACKTEDHPYMLMVCFRDTSVESFTCPFKGNHGPTTFASQARTLPGAAGTEPAPAVKAAS